MNEQTIIEMLVDILRQDDPEEDIYKYDLDKGQIELYLQNSITTSPFQIGNLKSFLDTYVGLVRKETVDTFIEEGQRGVNWL